MLLRAAILVTSCLLIGNEFAHGQTGNASLPKVAVPAQLEPYADTQLVLRNARAAIGLLGTAEFSLEPHPDADFYPKKIGPDCDTEEVRSFNRGYLLAHAGFNFFLSLQELGVPKADGPHGMPGSTKRNFVQFGRAALLNIWKPDQIRDLLEVRQSLKELPPPTRRDLSSFLSKLTEYRQHYARLKKARPGVIEDFFRREDHAYVWYEATWRDLKEKQPRTAISERERSKLLDEKLREISDVAKKDPARCFDEHYGPKTNFPSENLEITNTWIYPTKYLVSFWRRREMEGTSDLAHYVIAQVLETLRD